MFLQFPPFKFKFKNCLGVALKVNEVHWQLVSVLILLICIVAVPSNKTNIYAHTSQYILGDSNFGI